MLLTVDEMRGMLLDQMAEQDQALLSRHRKEGTLPALVREQVKQAQAVLKWNLEGLKEPNETDRIRARDLAIERLLEYPGRETEMDDPTLIDPWEELLRQATFDSPMTETR